MVDSMKKITASVLILATLFFSVLAVLSIWDIIEVERILRKSILTMVVIFCASVVILFVFSNFMKDNSNGNLPPR
jgi:predicted acyltransferase